MCIRDRLERGGLGQRGLDVRRTVLPLGAQQILALLGRILGQAHGALVRARGAEDQHLPVRPDRRAEDGVPQGGHALLLLSLIHI